MNNVFITALATGICTGTILFGLLILAFMLYKPRIVRGIHRVIDQKQEEIEKRIADFVTPPAADKPSKLALYWDAMTKLLAQNLVVQIKTSAMGEISGEVRGAAAKEIAATGIPGLGGLVKNKGLMNLVSLVQTFAGNKNKGNGHDPAPPIGGLTPQ